MEARRYIVVGGGIVGLATARALAHEQNGAAITVLEKEPALGTHQTAHNSGVVHQGLSYTPGSLKARLCRRGADLLRAFCRERGLGYLECGKLVVAVEEHELAGLDRLEARARANGVPDLRRLTGAELQTVEPEVRGLAALHSPRTASVDFVAVARAYADDVRSAGGTVRTGSQVRRVEPGRTPVVILADGERITAERVVVCAGLYGDRLARASGGAVEPRIVPFRGAYWRLPVDLADRVHGHIYPVPDPALPFLGVHLTRTLAGAVLIGPSAVPALGREGYSARDARLRDSLEVAAWPGTWRMLARHRRAAVGELARAMSRRRFVAEARRYLPAIRAGDVMPAGAGVRAQALDRDGTFVEDFRIDRSGGVVWVRNAPSPAATAALAIAEYLHERLVA